MSEKNILKQKFSEWIKRIRLPYLNLRLRLLLYTAAALLTIFSTVNVVYKICNDFTGIILYVLAAVTLCPACCYLARDIQYGSKALKSQIETHPLANRLTKDYRYRTVMFAFPGLVMNLIFAVFNGVIAAVSQSPWFGTFSVYYLLLSVMRFLTVRYDRKISNAAETETLALDEIYVYRNCGIIFIILTITLGGAAILLVHSKGGKYYPGFTIYAVAAYTFYKIIISVIHVVKAGKMKSPILMTIRSIGYVDACVSVLLLQTAMFTSFAEESEDTIRLMNGITGAVVCLMVLTAGVHCVFTSVKMKRL